MRSVPPTRGFPIAKPRVVASLLTKDQEFQELQASIAATAADRAGFDLDLVFAKNNSTLQTEQLYHYIGLPRATRPIAIVIDAVAGDGLPKVAREAAKAGVGWLLLNRDTDYVAPLRGEYPQLPIGIVTVDQVGIGRIQGQRVRALLPRGGSILCVQGPPDAPVARERFQGLQEIISNTAIDIEILYGEWTETSVEKAVRSWLRHSSSRHFVLDLVVAQNDAMAIGTRKAIAAERPEWSDRPFIGCDGLVDGGQRLVREAQLAATVVVPPTAGAAVNFVASHMRTRSSPTGRIVFVPRAHPALP